MIANAQNNLHKISESLVESVLKNEINLVYLQKIDSISYEDLLKLNTDEDKLAFWINIYNGMIYYELMNQGNAYKSKMNFFSRKTIEIGGMKLSFNDIEHGIIRKGKHPYLLGFLKSKFKYRKLSKFQPNKFDNRIHFALNCGAVSCPPVVIYSPKTLHEQLEQNTKQFLLAETKTEKNKVFVSKIFLWYYADFGKKKGILNLLKRNRVLEENFNGKLMFNDYNWNVSKK